MVSQAGWIMKDNNTSSYQLFYSVLAWTVLKDRFITSDHITAGEVWSSTSESGWNGPSALILWQEEWCVNCEWQSKEDNHVLHKSWLKERSCTALLTVVLISLSLEVHYSKKVAAAAHLIKREVNRPHCTLQTAIRFGSAGPMHLRKDGHPWPAPAAMTHKVCPGNWVSSLTIQMCMHEHIKEKHTLSTKDMPFACMRVAHTYQSS